MEIAREKIVGPAKPIAPYPVKLRGLVSKGFGRGSKELGIPTANLPETVSESVSSILETGIYYGYASVGPNSIVYPMVMSYGWNPYYKNEKRSAEVHIIHTFDEDFYGKELKIIILGYIRPELNYTTLEALIKDINTDIIVAKNSLERDGYSTFQNDAFLTS
jgi:riboflavin kinase